MIALVHTATALGFDGQLIDVECDITSGLPALNIVGLPNKAIDEAKERVRSALRNSGFEMPPKRITINLAPADLPKDGSGFDLPIAVAVMIANGQLHESNIKDCAFTGELSLNGDLKPIKGIVHIAEAAQKAGLAKLIVPTDNYYQAKLIEGIQIIGCSSLTELFLLLKEQTAFVEPPQTNNGLTSVSYDITIDDILGQETAKRALLIAAAGHHNILLNGPPGAGKTMLAKALLSILPPLTNGESIEVTKLHSLKANDTEVHLDRPFRAPHHSASHISLIGGGSNPRPGEVSLAHRGVLFLDELPEYSRQSIEALRQPLEDHEVHISRIKDQITFPADFVLVATQNPCPCGYYGDDSGRCECTMMMIQRYQKKVSGPLLDRIDLRLNVKRVATKDLLTNKKRSVDTPEANHFKQQIEHVRVLQKLRYGKESIYNGRVSNRDITTYFTIEPDAKILLDTASEKLQLSARSYFKTLKVAQTIADIDDAQTISPAHVSEALQYRQRTL